MCTIGKTRADASEFAAGADARFVVSAISRSEGLLVLEGRCLGVNFVKLGFQPRYQSLCVTYKVVP